MLYQNNIHLLIGVASKKHIASSMTQKNLKIENEDTNYHNT